MTRRSKNRPGSHVANSALLALAAGLSAGCGTVLQAGYGFTESVERPAALTEDVHLEALPDGAVVERHDEHGVKVLEDPRRDLIEYSGTETSYVPRSHVPLYLGLALEVIAGAAVTYVAVHEEGAGRTAPTLGAVALGAAALTDLVIAATYAREVTDERVRFVKDRSTPERYVLKVDGEARQEVLRTPGQERVRFEVAEQQPTIIQDLSADVKPPRQWYGLQVILTEAVAAVIAVAGFGSETDAMGYAGLAMGLVGPTVVHLLHGRYRNAGLSVGLRLGGPVAAGLAGGAFGALLTSSEPRSGALLVGTVTGGLAAVAMVIVDAAVLAWEPEEGAGGEGGLLVPTAGVTTEGAPVFGLAGRF